MADVRENTKRARLSDDPGLVSADVYLGPERRRTHLSAPGELTEEQIEEIAERAAKKAVEQITAATYQQIGKGVVSKAFWIIGVVAVAAFFWAARHGIVSPSQAGPGAG